MSWHARVVILPSGTLPARASAAKTPGTGERGLPHAPVAPGAASCQPGATPHALLVPKLCLGTPLRSEAALRTAGVSAGGRGRAAPACPADTPSLRSTASLLWAFPSKAWERAAKPQTSTPFSPAPASLEPICTPFHPARAPSKAAIASFDPTLADLTHAAAFLMSAPMTDPQKAVADICQADTDRAAAPPHR